MYDLLVQIDPIHWDKVIPDLAKSWQISEDGAPAANASKFTVSKLDENSKR
jgi:hypothetical protein